MVKQLGYDEEVENPLLLHANANQKQVLLEEGCEVPYKESLFTRQAFLQHSNFGHPRPSLHMCIM